MSDDELDDVDMILDAAGDAAEAAGAAAISSMTVLLLQRGCPVELLDAAWENLGKQEMAKSPGEMVRQFDLAIAEARL